jgi:YidC/Oxa1 family membrane protein insertase
VLRTNLPEFIKAMPLAQQAAEKRFWVLLPDITMSPQHVYSIVSSVPTATANATSAVVSTSTVVPQGSVAAGVIAVLPYMVLVVLFGLSVWLPQYLMTTDPTQRKTGTYMAVVMLYFGFVSPAGVLLYWVTSSGWQVAQQVLTQRTLKAAKQAKEAESERLKLEAAADKAAKKAAKSDQADKGKKK